MGVSSRIFIETRERESFDTIKEDNIRKHNIDCYLRNLKVIGMSDGVIYKDHQSIKRV